ncbi:cytochrome P450 [Streptomyces albipurpureus]|uniref:Cytochrome P450 n=1 Tax=Streptomyces albipurpureus TaxID=2897419 RepID=A0ABT0UQU1_9ACTN|nr:cytochrome P450 [Streptomyces sp. CWNU-1]MCM2390470.1 cytochrome P450 [Streptomyces sp. CWNU-1]
MRESETSPDEQVVSLLAPEFEEDPIGALARLRERSPLVRVGFPGGKRVWLMTRSEEIRKVVSDPRFVVDASRVPGHEGPSVTEQVLATLDLSDKLRDYFGVNLMLEDGESHVRLRRFLAPAFTVRRIEALRPRIEEISASLLDVLDRKGSGDLLHEYAAPLTSAVICELIGIDEADQPQIRKWMGEYANAEADFTTSLLSMCEHIEELIGRRRARPANDMISTLVQAVDTDGVRLSEADIISLAVTLVNAAYHTMNDFILNAVLVLEDNPAQLSLLRAHPQGLPHALEELMRIAPSVANAGTRYATQDLELAGVSICQGDALTGSIRSANFDPRYFPRPEQCDIQRVQKPGEGHLSFGTGPHRCIGAALANLEGEVAIDHLMIQRDSLEVTVSRGELTYHDPLPGGAPRLLTSLPVRI